MGGGWVKTEGTKKNKVFQNHIYIVSYAFKMSVKVLYVCL